MGATNPGAKRETWTKAYHGSYWYSVWSVLQNGMLESRDDDKGQVRIGENLPKSPQQKTARETAIVTIIIIIIIIIIIMIIMLIIMIIMIIIMIIMIIIINSKRAANSKRTCSNPPPKKKQQVRRGQMGSV